MLNPKTLRASLRLLVVLLAAMVVLYPDALTFDALDVAWDRGSGDHAVWGP